MTLRADDVMTPDVACFEPDTPIEDAIDLLVELRISGAPVVRGELLLGILSERDCLSLLAQQAQFDAQHCGKLVEDFMTPVVHTVSPDTELLALAGMFLSTNVRRLPVVDSDGSLIGQVTRRDVLRGIQMLRATDHQRAPR